MEKFCKDLKEYAIKKEMIPLTNKENKSYRNQKSYICKKEFRTDDKNVRDHCHSSAKYRGAAHDVCVCNLNYKAPKEIPIVFHNDSTYDYSFIIKELAK